MMDGEVVTKPEYLIMPSSVGFWAILMIYYFLGSKSGCHFFNWFQRKIKVAKPIQLKQSSGNTAVTTFMELIVLLWTFYLVLLFVYDENLATGISLPILLLLDPYCGQHTYSSS